MIDLNKLSNIDIKSIIEYLNSVDASQLKGILLKRKDILITVITIIASLIAINFIMKNRAANLEELQSKIKTLEEKTKVIEFYESENQKNKIFVESAPKGLSSFTEIINTISILADQSGVSIISFDPQKPAENNFFLISSARFVVSADQYKNILQFIEKIEQASQGLRIDSFVAQPSQRTRMLADSTSQSLQYAIQISSVVTKNPKTTLTYEKK